MKQAMRAPSDYLKMAKGIQDTIIID